MTNLEALHQLLTNSNTKKDKELDTWKFLIKIFHKEKEFKTFKDLEFHLYKSWQNGFMNEKWREIVTLYFDNDLGITVERSQLYNSNQELKYRIIILSKNKKFKKTVFKTPSSPATEKDVEETMKMLQEYS